MNDIEVDEKIVNTIKTMALFEEKINQRKPQSQQLNKTAMLDKLVRMVKNEKGKL